MKKTLLKILLLISSFGAHSQNNALSFDGMDDQVYLSSQGLSGASNFTIQLDVLTQNTLTDSYILLQFYDPDNGRFELRCDKGKLSLFAPFLQSPAISSFIVPINKFFNVALVKSGNTSTLYVNGSGVLTLDGAYYLGSTLKLGRYFSEINYSLKGQIDELRLWSTAKTSAEILNTPCVLKGNEANLVGYYDFNQGIAGANNTGISTLLDKTANKNNGVLSYFNLSGENSNWVASTNCGTTSGLNQEAMSNISDMYLYPNPAVSWLEIKGAAANTPVEIFSATGQLILSTIGNRIELPKNMVAGTYIANIKGDKLSKFVFVKE